MASDRTTLCPFLSRIARYWPGGATSLDGKADSQPLGLLDAMPASALQ
jgi:hypothetical protein